MGRESSLAPDLRWVDELFVLDQIAQARQSGGLCVRRLYEGRLGPRPTAVLKSMRERGLFKVEKGPAPPCPACGPEPCRGRALPTWKGERARTEDYLVRMDLAYEASERDRKARRSLGPAAEQTADVFGEEAR